MAPGVGAGIPDAEGDGICIGIIVAAGLGIVCWADATAVPAPMPIATATERIVNALFIVGRATQLRARLLSGRRPKHDFAAGASRREIVENLGRLVQRPLGILDLHGSVAHHLRDAC
jgi:hypothetical protein